MFEVPQRRPLRRNLAPLLSFLVHAIAVFVWVHREPIFVKPSSVAWGREGVSGTLIYLPPRSVANNELPKLRFHHRPHPQPKLPPIESARAGSPQGSASSGPSRGIEATPAIPLHFPDPDIYPWQLSGVKGDVVVEVTIDEKGSVADMRVLQGLQHDIDEKCIATLRNWRFRPAMLDGIAISSRQDVHFHFPS
ncbi:MAG TPA: TonB family protein [Terriglobales bacterium]|nr:TonB family protein [Terriglobales bacterium]